MVVGWEKLVGPPVVVAVRKGLEFRSGLSEPRRGGGGTGAKGLACTAGCHVLNVSSGGLTLRCGGLVLREGAKTGWSDTIGPFICVICGAATNTGGGAGPM